MIAEKHSDARVLEAVDDRIHYYSEAASLWQTVLENLSWKKPAEETPSPAWERVPPRLATELVTPFELMEVSP